jgi:hypothetical protein
MGGQQVLREIQLRTWHKEQFRQAVIENSELQADLIQRLEDFLRPLTGEKIYIPPRSPMRATIVKKTIELWLYLKAIGGSMILCHPVIGDKFDKNVHEEPNADDEQKIDSDQRNISWVLRRGFHLEEDGSDGTRRRMTVKALVFT